MNKSLHNILKLSVFMSFIYAGGDLEESLQENINLKNIEQNFDQEIKEDLQYIHFKKNRRLFKNFDQEIKEDLKHIHFEKNSRLFKETMKIKNHNNEDINNGKYYQDLSVDEIAKLDNEEAKYVGSSDRTADSMVENESLHTAAIEVLITLCYLSQDSSINLHEQIIGPKTLKDNTKRFTDEYKDYNLVNNETFYEQFCSKQNKQLNEYFCNKKFVKAHSRRNRKENLLLIKNFIEENAQDMAFLIGIIDYNVQNLKSALHVLISESNLMNYIDDLITNKIFKAVQSFDSLIESDQYDKINILNEFSKQFKFNVAMAPVMEINLEK